MDKSILEMSKEEVTALGLSDEELTERVSAAIKIFNIGMHAISSTEGR